MAGDILNSKIYLSSKLNTLNQNFMIFNNKLGSYQSNLNAIFHSIKSLPKKFNSSTPRKSSRFPNVNKLRALYDLIVLDCSISYQGENRLNDFDELSNKKSILKNKISRLYELKINDKEIDVEQIEIENISAELENLKLELYEYNNVRCESSSKQTLNALIIDDKKNPLDGHKNEIKCDSTQVFFIKLHRFRSILFPSPT